jgi:hypothetical protein
MQPPNKDWLERPIYQRFEARADARVDRPADLLSADPA